MSEEAADGTSRPGAGAAELGEALAGGGEMGARVRAFDWESTAVGPIEGWPQSLRTALSILLDSRFPMYIAWGSEYTQFYNDAYRPILGATKHPAALGRSSRETFAEVWEEYVGPLFDRVMARGEATYIDDWMLPLDRFGFVEECYFTFCYSAIRNEAGGVGGVLVTVVETTARVLGERRVATLRELAARGAEADVATGACRAAAAALGANAADTPFALVYLLDDGGRRLTLAGAAGLEPGVTASPRDVEPAETDEARGWPFAHVLRQREVVLVEDLEARFGALPGGTWPEPARSALVLPLALTGQERPYGVLIAGASPRLLLDDGYRGFFDLVAGQIATAIASARAYEEERARAEALAELDRAKTAFFSNVSHEFRTPLTLLLGPAEEAMSDPGTGAVDRARLEVIHRNARRLLRLVNTLLDFSRFEAGRVDATYEATDLAACTAELASTFRSATDSAGLRLDIDCRPLPQPVYVDRGMWEQVVLNLLSNAFKNTFDGEIAIRTRALDGHAEVEVADTGVGIAPAELPRIFERFHRVPNTRSRTHEGTGIGLALVREIVELHGGVIDVSSREGAGTTFVVRLPLGTAHLPAEHVRMAATDPSSTPRANATAYADEALRWLPDNGEGATDGGVMRDASVDDPARGGLPAPAGPRRTAGARLLVADDNADMRDYLTRLLRSQGWLVEAVRDGRAALEAALVDPPDLVLSDVMMPELDGFALLAALRADERMHDTAIILISARAGEEAKVEGLGAGADDYLVKPFSARELVARVDAQIAMARLRRERAEAFEESEARYRTMAEAEHAAREEAENANRAKSDFLAFMSHELRTPLNAIAGYVQLLEMGVLGPMSDPQLEALGRVQRSGHYLLSLINDVLNFAKLEARRVEYDVHDVPLGDVIADATTIFEAQFAANGIRHETRIPTGLTVRADGDKLRQIVLNLLSNAVKFTGRGGRVTIEATTGEDGADGARYDAVFLHVTDTGAGIPAEKQDAIFDPFVQVHRQRTSATEGTGLGLAISRDLARGMGGDLRVRSVEGEGSTFTLSLPRAALAPM